ncbi:MAG: hypothetical protein CMC79_02630 [Flavobacteriaceae bacterium]|nr:hypothetical protein [Flavobacteriaceae bacterium]|tara:strand:- start:13599 stop:14414 length:816 start_codon:yes stop_codon:yes gene_type:complete
MLKFFYPLFLSSSILSGQFDISTVYLSKKIDETSALEFHKGIFITLNDSGGKPKLYSFTSEGDLIDSHKINNAKNKDWEDLTADNDFIYISDTGNNSGNRKDLKIYKIDKELKLKDSIAFRYANQKEYKKKKKNRYDAEALTVVDSVLLLFSKDRKKLTTQVYSIPKKGGTYIINPIAEFNVGSLITAADYDSFSQTLALTSYNFEGQQFLYRFLNFDINNINEMKFEKYLLPIYPAQIEAIKVEGVDFFWLTSEDEGKGLPRLFKVCLNN